MSIFHQMRALTWVAVTLIASINSFANQLPGAETGKVIVVVGAAGAEEFREQFSEWADSWESAAKLGRLEFKRIGDGTPDPRHNDRAKTEDELTRLQAQPIDELWLVLIGHGTFDGEDAKFNLKGPDFSARELNSWLAGAATKTIVINCASSSAPFINQLAADDRIIVTSTKSGFEFNYSRFGHYLSETIGEQGVDLDKDKQVSLLEAFIAASSRTAEFYESRSRLATEQALIEDNGDGRGTPGDWFRGIRAIKSAADGSATDGTRANQVFLIRGEASVVLSPEYREKRDELELRLEKLRRSKSQVTEDLYYRRLEEILLELANLYRSSASKSDSDQ